MKFQIFVYTLSFLLSVQNIWAKNWFAEKWDEYWDDSKKTEQSSFETCKSKRIMLTPNGSENDYCEQVFRDEFSELTEILEPALITTFQNKLKEAVHTKIEFKIFETEMLKACATNNKTWFVSRGVSLDQIEETCKPRIDDIRKSIKERFPIMRREMALSKPKFREDRFLADTATWIDKDISHGLFSDFSKLDPLNDEEITDARAEYAGEIADVILEREQKKRDSTLIRLGGVNYKTFNSIITEEKAKNSELSDKEAFVQFLKTKQSFSIDGLKSKQDEIHKKHKEKYFALLSQMPLMGYIDKVDPKLENSPTDEQIAKALSKTGAQLSEYLTSLREDGGTIKNPERWAEYANFKPEIEAILQENPEYCGIAETLLREKEEIESDKMWKDLAIAGIAAVPCFMGGPIAVGTCIGAGLGVGAKGVYDAKSEYDNNLSRNLTDFLGADGFADFQKLDAKQKEVIMQTVLLPLGAFGVSGAGGRAALKSVRTLDDVGRFVTKGEGLKVAESALAKFMDDYPKLMEQFKAKYPNFDSLPIEEQEKLLLEFQQQHFEKLLAAEFDLPNNILSLFQKQEGGYKLIDTNYDMDDFNEELVNMVARKMGTTDKEAQNFIKKLYSKHIIDHHASFANKKNATQQVIDEYTKLARAVNIQFANNPLRKKVALAKIRRDLQRKFYRVGTDNLGDGQLATYLIRNRADDLINDKTFSDLMHKVANIEDFEAFGPGLYIKFDDYSKRLLNGADLSADQLEELKAMNIAIARQKAIDDLLIKYGTDENLGGGRIGLLYSDRFNSLPDDVQKQLIAELDEATNKILANNDYAAGIAQNYVKTLNELAGNADNPGLVRQTEVAARQSYDGLSDDAVKQASDEIFAFDASQLRAMYSETHNGETLGAFQVFHSPQSVLDEQKKVLVSISDTGEKRTFVVAFGNGLRQGDDTLKTIAEEIHLVEKRTLERLINETSDPEKLKKLKAELEAVNNALSNPDNIAQRGGPASMVRSSADDPTIKDLVFNFAGVRSSQNDIMEAVVRGRARLNQNKPPSVTPGQVLKPGQIQRTDLEQRQTIDMVVNELGENRSKLLLKYNPGNLYKLSNRDETYLAGIAEMIEKDLKAAGLDGDHLTSQVSQKLKEILNNCPVGNKK